MYTEIYNPVCFDHECINVAVYDDKVGFLCYKSDDDYSPDDIATPTYTIEESENIVSYLNDAIDITEKDFKEDVNSICLYWNVDKPCQKLEITALLCGNRIKSVLYYIESSVAYGDFDLIGGYMVGKSELIKLKNAIQKAIMVIKNENIQTIKEPN